MDAGVCETCMQPTANCRRSDRRATFCTIHMVEDFEEYMIIPCYFREKLNEFADKWIVAQTRNRHMFDLSLLKTDTRTTIIGPYWESFLRLHNVALGDIVTLELFNDNFAQHEHVELIDHEEVVLVEEPNMDAKFYMSVTDHIGNNKPRMNLLGFTLPEVPDDVRKVLQKAVFTDIWAIYTRNMSNILWEMYKEVGRFYEDEFYHVPDLPYFVHRLTHQDISLRSISPRVSSVDTTSATMGHSISWNRRLGTTHYGQ